MTISALVNYKHSLFTIEPFDTSDLNIIKSRFYGGVEYVTRKNELVLVISTSSIATASWELHKTLRGEKQPSKNDLEMFNDDMTSEC